MAATQRKSAAERIETLKQKVERLQAQQAALVARQKADDRRRDARRKIVVGAAVLAHAELNPSFRDNLREALQAAVTRDIDKAVIADLLEGKAPSPTPG
jgi:hypothetical protein